MQQAPPYTSAIAGNKWWEPDSQGNQEVGSRVMQRKRKEGKEWKRGEERRRESCCMETSH